MTPSLRMASILLLTFFILGCNRPDDGMVRGRKAITALMDSAECIMDDNPAYADSLMRSIDPSAILTQKQRARYALLYTASEYRNYQLITSDSLILEAVKYYSIRKNIKYRFLSYYYLGGVYKDLNKFTDASIAYSQAELLVDKIDNDFWKGLLYAHSGVVYNEFCIFSRALEYFNLSYKYYMSTEKDSHKYNSLKWIAQTELNLNNYHEADSVAQLVQVWAYENNDLSLYKKVINTRFHAAFYSNDLDRINSIYDNYLSPNCIFDNNQYDTLSWTLYYIKTKDFPQAEYYLSKANSTWVSSESDSVYFFYYNYLLAKEKGDKEETLKYLLLYIEKESNCVRKLFNNSILGVQKDYFKTITELESAKTHIRKTRFIASVILLCLIVSISLFISHKRRRDTENQIQDYISTINDLTTQISVNKDKISNLNAKVREMIRKQFNPSDYLYTRYYEQMDDSRKAEHVYRVVRNQLREFTNTKNLQHIDELLDEAFDGIMSKLSKTELEFKEKDMLLLRFALAGFSAKSIAALLDESHQNINQRKKRMLDKIQIQAPKLADELRIALNIRQINVSSAIID